MPSYRLYTIDRASECFTDRADFDAGNDEEAVDLARIRIEHCDLEIWCDARKVARVPKDGLATFF